MTNLNHIVCPICNKANTWQPENKFRPFCSDRCKLIDLGEWANESRAIPGKPVDFTQTDEEEDGSDES
jgi:endogenous inhibitor of DNA gyrase (YacG/DUF329 family)